MISKSIIAVSVFHPRIYINSLYPVHITIQRVNLCLGRTALSLPSGKIPLDVFREVVMKHLGAKLPEVLMGPAVGEDAAIIRIGEEYLIVSSDPVTGAVGKVGWLALQVNANDIAVRGVKPRWFISTVLMPENSNKVALEQICAQIDKGAKNLKIAIVGGHTEVTPNLSYPIVVGCMFGLTEKGFYVTSSGAEPGDKIILTKGIGIEGTAILASDRRTIVAEKFGSAFAKRAEAFFDKISVVEDAMTAVEVGGVAAMHDPTEGGLTGGLHELADASNTGFRVYEDSLIILPETSKICGLFSVDPLQVISSGSLLVIAKENEAVKIIEALGRKKINAAIIGDVVKKSAGRKLVSGNSSEKELVRPQIDHLWAALKKKF
jgi:hydrogenase expression/formation protein HypE